MNILSAVPVDEEGFVPGYKGEANGITFYLSNTASVFYIRFTGYEARLEVIDSEKFADLIASRIAEFTATPKLSITLLGEIAVIADEYNLSYAYDRE